MSSVLLDHCNHISWNFFFGEGPRSRSYWRTAALRRIVQPCDEDEEKDDVFFFFFIFPSNGAPVEWNWHGKTEVIGEKPVPVPLCPLQIPHGPARDRTRAYMVGGRRLTAWAMARPLTHTYRQKSKLDPFRDALRHSVTFVLKRVTKYSGCYE
jgi:hypothetical protein